MAQNIKTQNRKIDHLKIATSDKSQVGNAGFGNYQFIHNALPEINFNKIDTSTIFLGKKVDLPLFISCMTGGIVEGKKLNKNLAKAAQKFNIAIGIGSQRVAIENPEFKELYGIRNFAPSVPIMANVGLVQLNYGFGVKDFQKCVEMIGANALVVHINPIQEIIQPEGNRNWRGLLTKLSKVVEKLSVPVIAKEVGFGLSEDVVRRLYKVGVRYFDTAGWGGTNWALVEGLRGKADRNLGELFSQWGIPTAESIKMCANFKNSLSSKKRKEVVILGSGGVRNGIDIAKAMVLGSDMVGIASPFAKAAMKSALEVERLIERYVMELKTTMFGVGVSDVEQLENADLIEQR